MIQRNLARFIIVISCSLFFACKKDRPNGIAPSPAPVEGKTYSANEIIDFKQMTIRRAGNRIIKWPKNVSFYLVHTAYPHMTKEIDNILAEINQLLDNQLVLTRTTDWAAANIQVFLTDRDSYINAEPDTKGSFENTSYTGLAHLKWTDGVISRGSVFVDMSRTSGDTLQQRYIIHHEIMHALGFYGHATLAGTYTVLFQYTLMPYILNYTNFDKRMMLLLYNPAIRANMTESEFDIAVKEI